MTKEDIIKLAIEHTIHGLKFNEDGLLRFATLVAQQEREACAKRLDAVGCEHCSEVIREMGQA